MCFRALFRLLDALPADVLGHVISLAIDGTSATALLLDRKTGAVLKPPKLYNESQVMNNIFLCERTGSGGGGAEVVGGGERERERESARERERER